MRIVDVCGFYAPGGGGVRSYVEQKFQAAQMHGHELTVIAPGQANREEVRPSGRILWIESPAMPFDPAYRRFDRPGPVWNAISAMAPDVVEGSSPWRGGWIAGHWPGEAARAFVFHQDFVAGYPQTLLGAVMQAGTVDRLFEPWWERMRRLSARFDVTVAAGDWLARRLAGSPASACIGPWPCPSASSPAVSRPAIGTRACGGDCSTPAAQHRTPP